MITENDHQVYSYSDISKRLFDTVFGCPIDKGRIILLAVDVSNNNPNYKTTESGCYELETLDGGKFTISPRGKLISEISPSKHQIDYCYDKFGEGKVIAIHSYITDDGRMMKDIEETIFRDARSR